MEEIKQETLQDYVKAKPEVMPEPTYMPFVLALSLLFIGWGFLTTWILTAAGFVGFCISIYGWIKALLHERRDEES